ncbi:MAG: 23S rRNA (guanosine(2251)-2'-O)-methyltransferase RlmB [Bacteroidales bacterium]|nr:23S rRNA (guanosine(2251)-2'-O)-methyltransferase RlmB [Bacteroidales bacterium]
MKYIYGINPLIEAFNAGKTIEKIWINRNIRKKEIKEILTKAQDKAVKVNFVPDAFFKKFASKNHQGIIGILSIIEYENIENIITSVFEKGESPIIVILNGVTDVRNFGAIVRTSLCANADAILIESKHSVMVNEDAIKTSAGALFHIPICRTSSLFNTIKNIKKYGLQIVSCTETGNKTLFEIDFTKPTAIVLGDEDKGINSQIIKISDYTALIPLKNKISSLNVSVAAGIFLYEIKKQRLCMKHV